MALLKGIREAHESHDARKNKKNLTYISYLDSKKETKKKHTDTNNTTALLFPYSSYNESDLVYFLPKKSVLDDNATLIEKKIILVKKKKEEKKSRDLTILALIQDEGIDQGAALSIIDDIEADQNKKNKELEKKEKKEAEEKSTHEFDVNSELQTVISVQVETLPNPADRIVRKEEEKGFWVFKPLNKWFKFSMSIGGSPFDYEAQGSALKLFVNISPAQYFFISTAFNLSVNSYFSQYYQPDFSYSFGYSDWHPNTFGFSYSNYANNKFHPRANRYNFQQGTWEVNYKNKFKDLEFIDELGFFAAFNYLPSSGAKKSKIKLSTKFWENKILSSLTWEHYFHINQERFIFSNKVLLYDKFFASGSIYLYSDLRQQTSLEPDYAYSFGWLDTRRFYPSFTFSNYYTPTRWPSKDEIVGAKTKGTVSVSVRF